MAVDIDNSALIDGVKKLKASGVIKRDSEVAEALDYSKGVVSEYLNSKKQVSELFLKKFFEKFPNAKNVRPVTGLAHIDSKKSSSASNAVLLEQKDFTVMMVPLVNKYAYAGYQAGYGDDEYVEELPKVPLMVDKEHKGRYVAFEVRGDSMDNGLVGSYQDGYIVYGRELAKHHWRDKLHLKKWKVFVIVTKADGILIKEISKHDTTKGIITLHSWNEEYEDTTMHLDDVAQLLNVVQANFNP